MDTTSEYDCDNISDNKNRNEKRGQINMELKLIKRGFLPVKHLFLTRGNTAHLLFGISRLLKLDIFKRPLKTLPGWEAASPWRIYITN